MAEPRPGVGLMQKPAVRSVEPDLEDRFKTVAGRRIRPDGVAVASLELGCADVGETVSSADTDAIVQRHVEAGDGLRSEGHVGVVDARSKAGDVEVDVLETDAGIRPETTLVAADMRLTVPVQIVASPPSSEKVSIPVTSMLSIFA